MTDTTFYKLYSSPTSINDSSLFGNYDTTSTSKYLEPTASKSMFTGHELPLKNPSYINRNKFDFNYVFPFLIVDIIIILLLFNLYRKQSMHLALFSNKYYQQILSKSMLSYPISWLFFFVYIVNISLYIDIILRKGIFDFNIPNMEYLLPIIILLAAAFYAFKIILIYLTASIFNVPAYRRVYIDYIFLWTMSMGIFLSAYLWLEVYFNFEWLYFLFIGVWIIFGALRIITPIMKIIPKSDFNSFHFFIYLCTVEILPLIVLGKLVMLVVS
ncbi:MAG: DUF4271 domain-containing protein [Bacteroidales bacterium]|nr:DUF4271 domain-containing protein [Bacteroidales bacterium]